MIYRMKRNGAGLASICILSTMVLVMVSGVMLSVAWHGDMLHARYPGRLQRIFTQRMMKKRRRQRLLWIR